MSDEAKEKSGAASGDAASSLRYTTVQIPSELAQRLKVVAAVKNLSVKELVTKALAHYVADELEKVLPGYNAPKPTEKEQAA